MLRDSHLENEGRGDTETLARTVVARGTREPFASGWQLRLRRSRYALTFPSDEEGKVILFSTKTAASVRVPEGLADTLGAAALDPEDERALVEQGFLVPDLDEERRELLAFARDLEAAADTLHLIVVTAQGCNLACRYCYQGPEKGAATISSEVSAQLTRFATTAAFERGRDLHVTFYGGEPLLALERIVPLAEALKNAAAAHCRAFYFTFITNGTLLDRETAARLRPLGLRAAMITLDGPAETHDHLRPRHGGGGSFRRILVNLQETWDLLDLQINANFTQEHYRKYPRLLDELLAAGLGPARIGTVSFSPVSWESRSPHFSGGCRSLNEPWLCEAASFLREEALRRGFRSDRVKPSVCMVELAHELVVDCDGSLYKCPCFLGEERFRVGDLASGVRPDALATYAPDRWQNEECLACAYLPLCFGGCRWEGYKTAGTPTALECRRPFFAACLETLVRQDLRYG